MKKVLPSTPLPLPFPLPLIISDSLTKKESTPLSPPLPYVAVVVLGWDSLRKSMFINKIISWYNLGTRIFSDIKRIDSIDWIRKNALKSSQSIGNLSLEWNKADYIGIIKASVFQAMGSSTVVRHEIRSEQHSPRVESSSPVRGKFFAEFFSLIQFWQIWPNDLFTGKLECWSMVTLENRSLPIPKRHHRPALAAATDADAQCVYSFRSTEYFEIYFTLFSIKLRSSTLAS